MDQLDILKSKWQSQSSDYPVYSKEQIAGLLAKKSSSIVKWIFYIGIAEFVLLNLVTVLSIFEDERYNQTMETIGKPFYYGSLLLSYAVILYFIYKFWCNYRDIRADQSVRKLMKNILKTRRTMKWYIWFNLCYIVVFGAITSVMLLFYDPAFDDIIHSEEFLQHKFRFMSGYIVFVIFLLGAICAVVYGIYSLIYGILLRRLRKNYDELKKMEL